MLVAIQFRSRIDTKFKVLAFAIGGVALFTLWTRPRAGPPLAWAFTELLMLVVAALVLWITFATYYELEHDALVVRSGPFTWRVPLAEISAVRLSNSARSGPALSMDRLEILYGSRRSILVSPADKEEFLALLQRRLPRLASEQH